MIKDFLEWVCGGKELKYGGPKTTIPFPNTWTRPDLTWYNDLFGGKIPRTINNGLT